MEACRDKLHVGTSHVVAVEDHGSNLKYFFFRKYFSEKYFFAQKRENFQKNFSKGN